MITNKIKENKFCLSILIFLVFLFIFLIFKSHIFEEKFPLLSPSVSLIDRKDLLINFKSLENYLSKYKNNSDYLVSIYFEYLPTGANISINKDEKIWPASLIKIPFSMAVVKKIEKGILSMDDLMVLSEKNRDSDYGVLYLEPDGTTFSIRELLEETLIRSDNTAYLMMIENLKMSDVEEVYNHLGLDEVIEYMKASSENNEEPDISITAKRYTAFFRSLYNSTYLSPQDSTLFLNILSNAPCCYLCKAIPENIKFIHKFGIHEEKMAYADSGIVYIPNRPYLITVMIQVKKKLPDSKIEYIFKDISEAVFKYVYYAK